MAVDIQNIPIIASAQLASVTTIALANSSGTPVNGITLTSALETTTPGAEDSSLTISGLGSGAPVTIAKFSGKNTQWPLELSLINTGSESMGFTNTGSDQLISKVGGTKNLGMGTTTGTGVMYFFANSAFGMAAQGNGSVTDIALASNIALANAATNGFAHMPQCETTGVMSGVPSFSTGFFNHHAPFCFNRADNTFNIYNNGGAPGWKRTVALT